jgi:cytochrome c553
MFKTSAFGLLAGLTLSGGAALAAGNAAEGEKIALQGDGVGAPCVACHGPDGAGVDEAGFPRLPGLPAEYIAKQIRDYKSGARNNPIMQANLSSLSEQQIVDVAAYYAGMPTPVMPVKSVPEQTLALGEKLVTQGDWSRHLPACESCHGPGSAGVDASFPGIAGQHATYIRQQLEAWRQGVRANDPLDIMSAVAERLTEAEIDAVAAYLAAQPVKPSQGGAQ